MSESDYARENRRYWNEASPQWVASAERNWAQPAPTWGCWDIPESTLRMLPEDMSGMEAIELGCGTGYVSAWMARRGARAVGIDISERQLETARRLGEEHDVPLELIHGNGEQVPKREASFDFAISEYGAALWADPFVWVREAWRLLRPGGRLVFLTSHPLAAVCSPLDGSIPITETLERPYFGMRRLDWREAVDEPGGIEFNLPIGEWFRLLRNTGFEVEDFIEIQSKKAGSELRFAVTADWAHRFPAEMVWKVNKPAGLDQKS